MRRFDAMEDIWRNYEHTGVNRPRVRAVITRPLQKLFTYGLKSLGTQPEVTISGADAVATGRLASDPGALFAGKDVTEVYACHWAHDAYTPKELPNIRTLEWTRSVDQDAADMTLTMLNVFERPLGRYDDGADPLTPSSPSEIVSNESRYDMDQLGYFSPSRAATTDALRWGHTKNPWSGLLMPDNIIKTYQGYGVDWDVMPEDDPHLAQSGLWMIDEVSLTAVGLISIKCRDLGRMLLQHGFEAPVLPNDFNPTGFKAWTTKDLTRVVNVEDVTTVKKEFNFSDPAITQRTRIALSHPTSSTYFWRVGTNGEGGPGTVKDPDNYFGRGPRLTLDDDGSTYWISVGNSSPRAPFAYEWVEFDVPHLTVNEVVVHTVKAGYTAYVSVMKDGKWLGPATINYHEAHIGRNGSNIPFIASQTIPNEDRQTIRIPPVDNVQKLRITLGNLANFTSAFGGYAYRAGIRTVEAYATASHPGAVHKEYRDVTTKVTNRHEVILPPGAVGENPGTGAARYSDFTDIIKLICAWGGFYWPQDVAEKLSNSTVRNYSIDDLGNMTDPTPTTRTYHFDVPDTDVLGHVPGRVWGDFMSTGQSGPAPIDASNFKAKSLMDGIKYFQDIVSFNFWIDETGGAQWRYPNIDKPGNWLAGNQGVAGRTEQVWEIDEKQLLLSFQSTLSSRRLAEIVVLKDLVHKAGYVSSGYNPNPTGLRRSVIWNDAENLKTSEEAKIMGDLTAVRMLFSYRTNVITIPGFPGIQIDDQIRIHERTTSDSFLHLVTSISDTMDNTTGEWTTTLNTMWLGDTPEGRWVVPKRSREVRTTAGTDNQPITERTSGNDLKVTLK